MYLDVRKNFAEKAAYIARRVADGTVDEQASFLSVDCGLPGDTFNVIVVRDWSEPLQVLASIDHFIEKSWPFALWYWDSPEEQIDRALLRQRGLVHTETHSAMYANLAQIEQVSRRVEGLEIRQAVIGADIQVWGKVIADLFGPSEEGKHVRAYFQRLSSYPPGMFPDMQYYIGFWHGTVVATGTLFVGSQSTGIYDLVTDERYRGRGIGSAMFQHLLLQARTTARRFCVLQASPDGLRIYQKAGFSVCGSVLTFERRDSPLAPEERHS